MRKNRFATGVVAFTLAVAGTGISAPVLAQGTSTQSESPKGPVTHQGAGGQGTEHGMMGHGMMGQGMGPGMMVNPEHMTEMMNMMQSMMPGMMMGTGSCCRVQPANMNLSVSDVKVYFTNWLTKQGNPHLKLGNVTEKNADTITAEIVTQDGSLAQRFEVDRHSGTLKQD